MQTIKKQASKQERKQASKKQASKNLVACQGREAEEEIQEEEEEGGAGPGQGGQDKDRVLPCAEATAPCAEEVSVVRTKQ